MRLSNFVAGFLTLQATATLLPQPSSAKVPGQTYCHNTICHRVLTLSETAAEIGTMRRLTASFYDAAERDRFNPSNVTSSGERYRPDRADNAASPFYPNGTQLLVWNPRTGMAAHVRINNSGPYYAGRQLDVSRALAERLGFTASGTAELHSVVVQAPSSDEAGYKRGRTYHSVSGMLGKFASLEQAVEALDASAAVATVEQREIGLAAKPPADKPATRHSRAALPSALTGPVASRKNARSKPTQLAASSAALAGPLPSAAMRNTAWTGRFYD